MLPILTGLLFSLGFLFAVAIFRPPGKKTATKKLGGFNFTKTLKLDVYQDEAEKIGWILSKKDLLIIIGAGVVCALIVALITNNIFILIASAVFVIYLPKFMIEKKRQSNRLALISKLTDPLRMLLSRIPDQQNITKAIEVTRDETLDGAVRSIFNDYLSDVAIGGSVRDAMLLMKKKVKLKKFDVFVDYLIQAHYEGFTIEAMRALEKAVEAIEFDLRAIEKVRMQSKKKKQQLYAALGIAWLFPPVLSFISMSNGNIYLTTILGKILLLVYFLSSIFVCIKGEEYLSLNLEEL